MAFHDDLARHAEQVRTRLAHIRGEEATKQALIIPLLQTLGYDVFDPREVMPEYTADFAVKRAGQLEKIDYAICSGGQPVLFIECKAHDQPLEDHTGQLARYFNATPSVRIAVITNGVLLKVYADLQQPNVMDSKPWLSMDLLALKSVEVDALRRLRKPDFDAEAVVSLAEEMVYYNAMASYIAGQFRDPSEAFVRHVAGEVLTSTRLTKGLLERLTPICKKAIQSAILDSVAKSFGAAEAPPESAPPPPKAEAEEAPSSPDNGIVTTSDELECFQKIAEWIRETSPEAQVAYRDSKSYFTVHQGNLRKWFLRLNVQKQPMWLALRHVTETDLQMLAPGVPAIGSAGLGDSRVTLSGLLDLEKLRSAVIAAHSRERSRRESDDEQPTDSA